MFVITVVSVSVGLFMYFDSYIITYELNGGEMEETETRVWVDSEYSLPSPTKAGYAFAGWFLDDKYFQSEGVWQLEHDITLTARWGYRDTDGVIYDKNDDGYIIDYYTGEVKSCVVLPLKYNGESVVGIKQGALDALKKQIDDVDEGFIKVYIPSTAITEKELQQYSGIIVNRYNAIDKEGFIFLEEGGSVAVVGYNGSYDESIEVPKEHNGKEVESISNHAFYGTAKYLKKETDDFFRIHFPETIKAVGENAFALCDGVKVSLYYYKNNKMLEIINLSRLYDWISVVEISSGNDNLVKVITNIFPAFGWSEHTGANYYVRLDANGGEILQNMTIVNGAGKEEIVRIEVNDTTVKKNAKYNLPIPTRDGYTFEGWYYGENPVAIEGNSWGFDNHIEITAKWKKEG